MGDIMRLLLGGPGDEDSDRAWGRGRRPRIAESRQWCGSAPGEESVDDLAAALGGRRGGRPGAGSGKRASRRRLW